MIHRPFSLDNIELKIDDFILSVTGLKVEEINTEDLYEVRVGVDNPIRIGFYKSKHPNMPVSVMKYSARVLLIKSLSDGLREVDQFRVWVNVQHAKLN